MLRSCLEYLEPIAEARNSELDWLLSGAHPDAESLTPLRQLVQSLPAREPVAFREHISEEDISEGLGDSGYFEGHLASGSAIALRFNLTRLGEGLHLSVDYNPIGDSVLSTDDYRFEYFYARHLFENRAQELGAQKLLWSTEVRVSIESQGEVPLISISPKDCLGELARALSGGSDSVPITPYEEGPCGSVSVELERGGLSFLVVLSSIDQPLVRHTHGVENWYYRCAAYGAPNRASGSGYPRIAVHVLPRGRQTWGFLPEERVEVLALTAEIAAEIRSVFL